MKVSKSECSQTLLRKRAMPVKTTISEVDSLEDISENGNAGIRRKRKTERDLNYLRKELKKEFLWSREKIIQISEKLNLAETQVYKWWWDQTRKRQKQI